jgi:hypothetical protein
MSDNNDQADRRSCIRCKRWFDSEWPGNRICQRCKKRNDKLSIGVESFDIDNSGYPFPVEIRDPEVNLEGISNKSPNRSSQAPLS